MGDTLLGVIWASTGSHLTLSVDGEEGSETRTTSPSMTREDLDTEGFLSYIRWREGLKMEDVDLIFEGLVAPEEVSLEEAEAFAAEANKRAFPRSHMLLETANIVEQRQATYGPPEQHWKRTIDCINTQFSDYLKKPLPVWAWPVFMILDKASRRTTGEYNRDHPRDVAGYANGWSLVEETTDSER
jgi:hypothetical protein